MFITYHIIIFFTVILFFSFFFLIFSSLSFHFFGSTNDELVVWVGGLDIRDPPKMKGIVTQTTGPQTTHPNQIVT